MRLALPIAEKHPPLPAKLANFRPPIVPADYLADPTTREIHLHEIDLYVTMKCNIRCDFCSVSAGEYEHEDLPLDRILKLIGEAVSLGLEELHFLGGEPTLRKDLEVMIEAAASRGLATRVITNGMLLDQRRIRAFVDAGLEELMVSIDGLEENHNLLRQCGTHGWGKAVECVRNAVDVGIRTRIAMTAYMDNYDDVLPLLELSHAMG